jgi:hypothetical protein
MMLMSMTPRLGNDLITRESRCDERQQVGTGAFNERPNFDGQHRQPGRDFVIFTQSRAKCEGVPKRRPQAESLQSRVMDAEEQNAGV